MQTHQRWPAVGHQQAQRLAHHRFHQQGIAAQLSPHHLAGNVTGQAQHFLRHLLLHLGERGIQFGHHRGQPLRGLLRLMGLVVVHALLPLPCGLCVALLETLRMALGVALLVALRASLLQPLGQALGKALIAGGLDLLTVQRLHLRRQYLGSRFLEQRRWLFSAIDGAEFPERELAHLLAGDEAGVHLAIKRKHLRHRRRSRSVPRPRDGGRS